MGLASEQFLQHPRVAAIGQTHPDATGGGDPGRRQLCGHPPRTPVAAASGGGFELIQFRQVAHLIDGLGAGVLAGITGLEAIHIGEQHQFRCL